jgi:hypothetical protein
MSRAPRWQSGESRQAPKGLGDAPAGAVRRQVPRAGAVVRETGYNGVRRSEEENLAQRPGGSAGRRSSRQPLLREASPFRRVKAAGGNRQRKRGDREVPGEGEPCADAEHHQQAAIPPRVAVGGGRPRCGRLLHHIRSSAAAARQVTESATKSNRRLTPPSSAAPTPAPLTPGETAMTSTETLRPRSPSTIVGRRQRRSAIRSPASREIAGQGAVPLTDLLTRQRGRGRRSGGQETAATSAPWSARRTGMPERRKTSVGCLITQRSRVQIPPPLPGQRPGGISFRAFCLPVVNVICLAPL